MSTIQFRNPGVIDVRSITTFGVSVKEGDNPIGFFGTGLKYAIAVLLRTGHAVSVYAGPHCFSFGVRSDHVRGKQFDFVTMAVDAGEPLQLGFTTELGKQWEVWMAYRELACNCIDEKGTIEEVSGGITVDGLGTTVAVTGDAFAEVYHSRTRFILEDEPAYVLGTVEIRERAGSEFYYRGVRVHRWAQHGLFTYSSRAQHALTEDRTLKSDFSARQEIAQAFLRSTNTRLLERVLTADKHSFEGTLDFDWILEPSEEFIRTVGEAVSMGVSDLNPSAVKMWRRVTKKEVTPREVTLTAVQLQQLNRALDFCGRIGFPVRGTYPIKIAESLGDGTLGLAYEGTIFIAERVFHQGTKQLAATLIEEYLHLRHHLEDESRELQTYLFDRVVSLGEELVGAPL